MRLLILLLLLPVVAAQGLCNLDVALSTPTVVGAQEVAGGVEAALSTVDDVPVANAPLLVVAFDGAGDVVGAFVVYTNASGRAFVEPQGNESSFYFIFAGNGGNESCILYNYLSSVEGFAEWWAEEGPGSGVPLEEVSLSHFPTRNAPEGELEPNQPLLPSATLSFITRTALPSATQLPPELCLPLAALIGVSLASFFARGMNPFYWMGLRVNLIRRPQSYEGLTRTHQDRTALGRAYSTAAKIEAAVGKVHDAAESAGEKEGKGKQLNAVDKAYRAVGRITGVLGKPLSVIRDVRTGGIVKRKIAQITSTSSSALEPTSPKGYLKSLAGRVATAYGLSTLFAILLRALGFNVPIGRVAVDVGGELERNMELEAYQRMKEFLLNDGVEGWKSVVEELGEVEKALGIIEKYRGRKWQDLKEEERKELVSALKVLKEKGEGIVDTQSILSALPLKEAGDGTYTANFGEVAVDEEVIQRARKAVEDAKKELVDRWNRGAGSLTAEDWKMLDIDIGDRENLKVNTFEDLEKVVKDLSSKMGKERHPRLFALKTPKEAVMYFVDDDGDLKRVELEGGRIVYAPVGRKDYENFARFEKEQEMFSKMKENPDELSLTLLLRASGHYTSPYAFGEVPEVLTKCTGKWCEAYRKWKRDNPKAIEKVEREIKDTIEGLKKRISNEEGGGSVASSQTQQKPKRNEGKGKAGKGGGSSGKKGTGSSES